MATQILVADDHQMVREGIVQLVEQREGFQVVGQAKDGVEALNLIKRLRPHIAVIDISMPRMTGIDLVRSIKEERLNIGCVLLTMHPDEEFLNEALEHGVLGYILKENSADDLLNAIECAARKAVFVSPLISEHLLNQKINKAGLYGAEETIEKLSPAEVRILRLIADKKTSKQIAKEICVSVRTVQNHRANICQKLKRTGSNSLLHFAMENKKRLYKL